jgi:hypothetical protein
LGQTQQNLSAKEIRKKVIQAAENPNNYPISAIGHGFVNVQKLMENFQANEG